MTRRMTTVRYALGAIALIAPLAAQAQVPANIEAELKKIGQIVDPACTAKLYRPLMPANDVNGKATPLYPGIAIARDVSFGPNPKDVVDIFTSDKGGGNRPVLIYVPGGGGNKTEQQDREANAFYDNIGRWGTKNGMVVVLMQRHPGANWDDPAKDVSSMFQWVEANISKYKGNPDRMFAWAQSAGNGPLGTYVGRPELYGPKGVGALYVRKGVELAALMLGGHHERDRRAGTENVAGAGALGRVALRPRTDRAALAAAARRTPRMVTCRDAPKGSRAVPTQHLRAVVAVVVAGVRWIPPSSSHARHGRLTKKPK